MISELMWDACPSYRSNTGRLGGIWLTKNLNHLKKTSAVIHPNLVPVNKVSGGAPVIRSTEILCRGKIIIRGITCPDADPQARIVLVRPFSALVRAHTVFCPLLAQIFVGLCTQDIPVSSALYI